MCRGTASEGRRIEARSDGGMYRRCILLVVKVFGAFISRAHLCSSVRRSSFIDRFRDFEMRNAASCPLQETFQHGEMFECDRDRDDITFMEKESSAVY